jgi:hypothetical protein
MSLPNVIECTIAFGRRRLDASKERTGDGPAPPAMEPSSRVPRIARRMALALHVEALVRDGTVSSYADVARLGHVSRARVCQILSLLQLAPDLQEQLLFLPRPAHGRDPLPFRQVLAIAAVLDWDEQRRRWRKLQRAIQARGRTVS